jgi:drug/metabolite transporter (DMT)-like permease
MEKDTKKTLRGSVMLLLAALFWGIAFAAQSKGMDYVGPFTFNGARSILGVAVLLPLWVLMGRPQPSAGYDPKALWLGGSLCGLMLFAATSLQQVGLVTTSAGKSGFLTALYIVLVPLFGIFLHRRVGLNVWFAVVLATGGLYLLCAVDGFTLAAGDMLTLLCAVCFALQIMLVDKFAPRTNPLLLCAVQFAVVGILSTPLMFLFETPSLAGLWEARIPLLYTGIMSSAVSYSLQIGGQRDTEPALASLLMSFESVFSVLAGALLLHERLTVAELFGCVLVFAAILLAQFSPFGKKTSSKEK